MLSSDCASLGCVQHFSVARFLAAQHAQTGVECKQKVINFLFTRAGENAGGFLNSRFSVLD